MQTSIRRRGWSGQIASLPLSLLPAGLRVAQPCRYCFYSMVQKWVFRLAGATRCPDKREINLALGADRSGTDVYRGENVGIQPHKLSN